MGFWKQLVLACNRNIESIDKSRCQLRDVPPEVLRYAKTLLELNLEVNDLESLPQDFWKMTKLRYLNISDNGIRQLSSQITTFLLLTHLDISRNEIRVLPNEINLLVNLTYLDISRNSMMDGQVPPGLWRLRNLNKLMMNDICLLEIPEEISTLNKLERLELRDNFLKTLPVTIGVLTRLRLLDLGGNDLYELPYEIGDLTALRDLFLDDNALVELPKTIDGLRSLESLDVTQNELEYLPDQLGNLKNLNELLMDTNDIENLPTSISHLKQLCRLKITENMLTCIPQSWGNCTSLTEVFFTSNGLKEIPESIGNLVNLRSANFDQNGITSIPESIGKCVKLGVLSFRDNCLTEIPSSIENLTELYVLDLTNNRLEWLPFSIGKLGRTLKALWLSETQGSQSLPTLNAEMRGTKKVLTCVFLPQKTGSMENLLAASMTSLHFDEYNRHHGGDMESMDDIESGVYDTGETTAGNEVDQRGWGDAQGAMMGVQMRRPPMKEARFEEGIEGGEGGGSKRESKVSFQSNDAEIVDDELLNQYTTELKRHHTPHPKELAFRKEQGRVMVYRTESARRREETHINLTNSSPQKELPSHSSSISPPNINYNYSNQSPPISISPSPTQALMVGGGRGIGNQQQQQHLISSQMYNNNQYSGVNSSSSNIGRVGLGGSNSTTVAVDITPISPDQLQVEVDERLLNKGETRKFDMGKNSIIGSSSPTPKWNTDKLPTPPQRSSVSRFSAASAQQGNSLNVKSQHKQTPSDVSDQLNRSSITAESSSNIEEDSDSDLDVSREKTVGFSDDVTVTTTTATNGGGGVHLNEGEDSEADQAVVGGEAKRVGLVGGVESVVKLRPKKTPMREDAFLERRDTPHHKKGKRLVDEGKELTEEELQQLLAGHHNQLSPTSASAKQPYLLYSDDSKYEFEDRQFVCVVTRGPGVGFGLTIAGGIGSLVPYRPGDDGIFLSNIIVNSPAFLAGLRVGDKILSVDGNDLSKIDHSSAVEILRNGGISITLTVERRIYNLVHDSDNNESESVTDEIGVSEASRTNGPVTPLSPFFTIDVKLRREVHQGFGFSFNSASIQNETGLKVTKIAPDGVAAKEGTLHIGDLIQSINDVDVTNGIEGRDSAVNILRSVFEVSLAVVRKSDVFKFPHVNSTAKLDRVPAGGKSNGVRINSSSEQMPEPERPAIHSPLPPSPPPPPPVSRVSPLPPQNLITYETGKPEEEEKIENNGNRVIEEEKEGDMKLDHVEEVVLVKTGEPLGFSIKGGTDHPMHICGLKDTSVYISKITSEGLACRSNLVVGDKILFANGINLNSVTHKEAVNALVSPPHAEGELDCLTLLVAHEYFLSGYKHLELKKHFNEVWGIMIQGGLGYQSANPYEPLDESIYITGVVPYSPADNCTLIQPGQRIIEINNKSMVGVSYPEAKYELSSSKFDLKITVCDGFNYPAYQSSRAPASSSQKQTAPSTTRKQPPRTEANVYHMNKSISSIVEQEHISKTIASNSQSQKTVDPKFNNGPGREQRNFAS